MSPLLFLCGFSVDLCNRDAANAGRWNEGEGIVAEGRREVPRENFTVLRLCVIGESPDDELSRKRKLSELDPYLPIDTLLAEGVLLAGNPVHSAGADIVRCLDPLGDGLVRAPIEQVGQRKFDSILIV